MPGTNRRRTLSMDHAATQTRLCHFALCRTKPVLDCPFVPKRVSSRLRLRASALDDEIAEVSKDLDTRITA